MTWDFPEVNPFANAAGDFSMTVNSICKCLVTFCESGVGYVYQKDATTQKLVIWDDSIY